MVDGLVAGRDGDEGQAGRRHSQILAQMRVRHEETYPRVIPPPLSLPRGSHAGAYSSEAMGMTKYLSPSRGPEGLEREGREARKGLWADP